MTRLLQAIAFASVFTFASMAAADTVSYTGNTETSADGSWMHPNATFTALDADSTLYSVQVFTVSADGLYDISSIQGANSVGTQFDGMMFLYANAFDPSNGLLNGIGADDDGSAGAGTSELFKINLTAGTTYYLVTTGFTSVDTAFGSGSGPFTNTLSGPGDIELQNVPLPAAVWLMMSGLAGLGVLGRRRTEA